MSISLQAQLAKQLVEAHAEIHKLQQALALKDEHIEVLREHRELLKERAIVKAEAHKAELDEAYGTLGGTVRG